MWVGWGDTLTDGAIGDRHGQTSELQRQRFCMSKKEPAMMTRARGAVLSKIMRFAFIALLCRHLPPHLFTRPSKRPSNVRPPSINLYTPHTPPPLCTHTHAAQQYYNPKKSISAWPPGRTSLPHRPDTFASPAGGPAPPPAAACPRPPAAPARRAAPAPPPRAP